MNSKTSCFSNPEFRQPQGVSENLVIVLRNKSCRTKTLVLLNASKEIHSSMSIERRPKWESQMLLKWRVSLETVVRILIEVVWVTEKMRSKSSLKKLRVLLTSQTSFLSSPQTQSMKPLRRNSNSQDSHSKLRQNNSSRVTSRAKSNKSKMLCWIRSAKRLLMIRLIWVWLSSKSLKKKINSRRSWSS